MRKTSLMASCCDPRGYNTEFNVAFAQRLAKRYRRRGLDPTARRIVEVLTERGINGATVLEIGGGIGDIQIELLKRGASGSVIVELSAAYDADAAALLRAAGLTERADRRILDIVATPDAVDSADVVVMHRVVCCYADYAALLAAAADHARRLLVFSYPPNNAAARLLVGVDNLTQWIRRRQFRSYVHEPSHMLAVLQHRGLNPSVLHHGRWHIAIAERDTT
jgi:cyclopropane fatty-acyl-phospholipid synthase-like methyltransferase